MVDIRLLAIAPSGETYFAEIAERVWLVRPVGEPRPVDRNVVERAVTDHGFQAEDRVFGSSAELDSYRNEVARHVVPEAETRLEDFDEEDVEEMLAVARRWHADGDRRAMLLARQLLNAPVVRTRADLLGAIADLLEVEEPADLTVPTDLSAAGRAARQRFLDAPAAA